MHPPRYLVPAVVYAAFIVYGSLIPFKYRATDFASAWTAFRNIPYLQLGIASRADWVSNILLYVPLAFLLAGAWVGLWRTSARRWLAAAGVFALCAALAVAIEFVQIFFPQRTVSLNDIYAETLGSGLGVVLWLRIGGHLERFRQALAAHSAQTPRILAMLYFGAYVLLALFPFDVLVSGRELAWKLNGGSWGFWLAPNSCAGGLPCTRLLLAELLAALPVGLGLGFLLRRRTWAKGLADAALWGFGLGLALESTQWLTVSNISQGASVVCRGLGVMLGYAVFRAARPDWLARSLRALACPWLLVPCGLLYIGILARLLLAGKGSWMAEAVVERRFALLRFIPFYYHYFTSETHAVESLITYFMLYVPIGVLVMAGAVRREIHPAPSGPPISGGLGFLAAGTIEAIKLFLPYTRPDPTNALIGTAGALFGYWVTSKLVLATTAPDKDNPV